MLFAWALAAALFAVEEADERRCLTRYEAEWERGSAGLCALADESGNCSA